MHINIKTQLTKALFTFSAFIFICCGQTKKITKTSTDFQRPIETGNFISMNFSDTNFMGFKSFARDTVTVDGWAIKYLVKDDSTKYNDIYIDCSKGSKHEVFFGADLLQLRPGFISRLTGETKSHLFFWHRCATDCQALLVLFKDTSIKFKDYESVIDYNLNIGQLLYIPVGSYENPSSNFTVKLFDFLRNKEYKISFKEVCGAANMVSCIDTVIFKKSEVTVKATLRANIDSEKNELISKTIKL